MESSSDPMEASAGDSKIKLRSYQQEMLAASMKRNVIVAMDTGSGKTPIATFRILAELERTDCSKLVWFVAPNVALSRQQYDVLVEHLPGYLVKILLGADGVDKWTDQRLWDAFLAGVRVVASTPAILADALTHGFVPISRLSLLVFDEAHHCVGNSPMNRIMRDFYHPAKDGPVPHVLGLSASPVISAKSTKLEKLESSLDSIAITPKDNRSDLDSYVHPPELLHVVYASPPTFPPSQTPRCTALQRSVQAYNFSADPYVLELQELIEGEDARAFKQLESVKLKRKTWCTEQLSAMSRKSTAVLEQLGPAAAEWYVSQCQNQYAESQGTETLVLPDVSERERAHLLMFLNNISPPDSGAVIFTGKDNETFTPKVQQLIHTLLQHSTSFSANRAVIFAEQRAVVIALGRLLQNVPELAHAYSFGTFVGTSTSDKRKTAVSDLVDLRSQSQSLGSFRDDGRVNVLIATSVLEEGIDVTACNLVICFDLPKNLVQFVQRRGRARQRHSKYIMLVAEDDVKGDVGRWTSLEQEMKRMYRDEHREPGSQPEDECVGRIYRVSSTGASLDFDNAKAHLYHFCQVSSRASKFVDVRPEFATEKDHDGHWTATVVLPSFVHSSLRTTKAREKWSKEGTAIKDAALEAYIALHKGCLVNDNLLPCTQDYGPEPGQIHVDQPSLVIVSERQSSWLPVCRLAARSDRAWYASEVRLFCEDGTRMLSVIMHLPVPLHALQPIKLYWNEATTYTVEIERLETQIPIEASGAASDELHRLTDSLLRSVYSTRMEQSSDMLPFSFSNDELRHAHFDGRSQPLSTLSAAGVPEDAGLVHVQGETGRAYFLSGVHGSSNDFAEQLAVLRAFPKRRDFLHPLSSSDKNAAYTAKQLVPIEKCTIDALPAKYSVFAAFIPSILRKVDVALLAADLQSNVLSAVPINEQSLIEEAISSPSAREASDYNRLEFLGDAMLKFCAVLHVMAKHPTWPEGYLELEKFRLVSNNALAKAALSVGLDRFILTKEFTGSKWRPPYVKEVLTIEPGTREMSSKMLADVVEALIGACFVDGGLSKAYDCLRILLPEEQWTPMPDCINVVVNESLQEKHIDLGLLERLVGHNFNHPELLIEALTHASFPHAGQGSSYERLEFLGDAVLDLIIVPKLFSHHRKLKHYELHRVRNALVNGDYLAYCCMQHSVEEERFDVVADRQELGIQQSERKVHLHDFLRAGSQLKKAKRLSVEASAPHLNEIKHRLEQDSQYPWPELIAFKPPKFFSDIIESTLAALFLDTAGDLSVCERYMQDLGIFDEMRRILDEQVETAYPKEQLGILADKEGVEYLCTSRVDEHGITMFDCTVKVGGEEVAMAVGCGSKEEAELRAARKATVVMEKKVEKTGNGKKRKLDVAEHQDDQEVEDNVEAGDQPAVAGAMMM